jgi:ribosome-associated toxin RatA of RatAB toxin-antitoxin module
MSAMASVTRLTLCRRLRATVERSYGIVVDIERFPEFMDNVTSVKILSSEAARKVVAWEMMIDDAPLDWVEEVRYDAERCCVDFRALEGVFERFDGRWQVLPDPMGSRVELNLEYEIGLPEIEDVIGPILKTRLRANLESMIACLNERASS